MWCIKHAKCSCRALNTNEGTTEDLLRACRSYTSLDVRLRKISAQSCAENNAMQGGVCTVKPRSLQILHTERLNAQWVFGVFTFSSLVAYEYQVGMRACGVSSHSFGLCMALFWPWSRRPLHGCFCVAQLPTSL